MDICLAQFYKIRRTDGKSLADRMEDKVEKVYDPAHPDILAAHTEDDVTRLGTPGVSEPLNSDDISNYCAAPETRCEVSDGR